jgi:hypothetical protein
VDEPTFRMRTSGAFATWRVCLSRVIASSVRPAARYAPDPAAARLWEEYRYSTERRIRRTVRVSSQRAMVMVSAARWTVLTCSPCSSLKRAREIREALAAQVIRKHPRRV